MSSITRSKRPGQRELDRIAAITAHHAMRQESYKLLDGATFCQRCGTAWSTIRWWETEPRAAADYHIEAAYHRQHQDEAQP